MTATRVQHSSTSWLMTCSGRLVSTTTSRVLGSARMMASWGERKMSLYSGTRASFSAISEAGLAPPSLMMRTGTPFFRAMAHTPAQAPMQSRSGNLWPMTNT